MSSSIPTTASATHGPLSATAAPQVTRRLSSDSNPGNGNTGKTPAPGISETSSNLSEGPRLSTVPSHDNSSQSGSEKGTIERVNPFEVPAQQQHLVSSGHSVSSAGRPLEQIGSHHSASPDRTLTHSQPSSPLHPNYSNSTNITRSPQSHSHMHPAETAVLGGPQMPQFPTEEDDFTHSSSAVNSTEPASSYTPSTEDRGRALSITDTFSRFLENTRKRMSRPDSADDMIEDLDGRIIQGYLQKLGRNGKWQTRWFESDGECLSYYKNENRTKLLATLDLEKVGAIELDPSDDNECSLTIQVLGRLYHLRAENKVACTDWVITLNRIKEARMNQGNVKLVGGYQQHNRSPGGALDLLDQNENLVAPRVVVVSNRQRTRAVAQTQDFDQIMLDNEENSNQLQGLGSGGGGSSKRLSTIGTVVLARWNKRRSSLSRLRSKLTKWARSLRNLSCTSDGNIGLDNHVHPPGHDDARISNKNKHLGWIGKETTAAAPDVANAEGDDANARMRARKMSSASEDIRVLS